jgi:hypothetical protein
MSRLDKGGLASQIRNENFDEGSFGSLQYADIHRTMMTQTFTEL